MDQNGRFAISLLSGHLGGANNLAREMASLSGGQAVITTATDVQGQLSFDSFAKANRMAIENIGTLKHISGALLEGRPVSVYSDIAYDELKGNDLLKIYPVSEAGSEAGAGVLMPAVVIDEGFHCDRSTAHPVLYLRPRTICAGIGCKRGMARDEIEKALMTTLRQEGLSPLSLRCICTIPLKADEPGIIGTADNLNVPLKVIPAEEIRALDISSLGISTSEFVQENTGVLSVSTASAYIASGRGTILCDKAKYKGITVALAKVCP